jgi:hypothetical protein
MVKKKKKKEGCQCRRCISVGGGDDHRSNRLEKEGNSWSADPRKTKAGSI